MTLMQHRFEAWAKEWGINLTRLVQDPDEYAFGAARAAWAAWRHCGGDDHQPEDSLL